MLGILLQKRLYKGIYKISPHRQSRSYAKVGMGFLIALLLIATCVCFSFEHSRPTGKFMSKVTRSSSVCNMVTDGREPSMTSVRDITLQRISANFIAMAAALAVYPTVAAARQGAFEMDLEYYLKTVASRAQGKPDAVINAKTNKPAFASARSINKDLASAVIDVIHTEMSRIAKTSIVTIKNKVDSQMLLFLPYFKEYVPIKVEDLSDQYCFDITLYVTYLLAAQLIPKSTDRVVLRKAVGDGILDLLIQKKLIVSAQSSKQLTVPDNLLQSTGAATCLSITFFGCVTSLFFQTF